MDMHDLLTQRQNALGLTTYEISKRYGAALGDPDNAIRYSSRVTKILAQPEKAQLENLARVWAILGVDINTAIAIAASQPIPD